MANDNLIQGRVKDPEVMAFWKHMRRSYEPGILVEMAIKALMGVPIQESPYADLQGMIYETVKQATQDALKDLPQAQYYYAEPVMPTDANMIDFSDIDDDPMMGEF